MDEEESTWEDLCELEGLSSDWAHYLYGVVERNGGDLQVALDNAHEMDSMGLEIDYWDLADEEPIFVEGSWDDAFMGDI